MIPKDGCKAAKDRMYIYAHIANKYQALLYNSNQEMIGMLESPILFYLLSRMKAIIINPKAIEDEDIVLYSNGTMNKTATIKVMMEKGSDVTDIVYRTGINRDFIHQITSRIKINNAINTRSN